MKKFNFAAAIWGRLWMAYHFLILPLTVVSILEIIVHTFIEVRSYYYSDFTRALISAFMTDLLYICLKFFLFGFIGNQFLEHKKEKRIYKFIEYFEKHEKSIVFRVTAVFLYFWWLTVGERMLVHILANNIFNLST